MTQPQSPTTMFSTIFKSVSRIEWLVLALLIALGIASRFYLEIPNCKPVAAFVLFGGFFFRRPSLAVIGVIALMALSDFRLGTYDWQLMLAVYSSLAIAAGLGWLIRKRMDSTSDLAGPQGRRRFGFGWLLTFGAASLVMSTAFFLLTNGAVWMMGSWYPMTWSGLLECYVAGLPFYRWTMCGDLVFTIATTGFYFLICELSSRSEKTAVLVEVN